MRLALSLILVFLSYTVAERKSYKNYSVYSLTPNDELSIQKLKFLEKSVSHYDFWTPVSSKGVPVDIMVSPELKPQFLKTMQSMNVKYQVKIKNVQESIDKTTYRKRNVNKGISWRVYNTLDEIYQWLRFLTQQFPDKVSIITVGHTYERRNVTGVKVSFSPCNKKKNIFIEANINAREWITNAVATYILNQVLTNKDAHFRKLVESFNWYFVPVANPDGYVFTHTTNRLWKKNRSLQEDICIGVDINRNWDFHWNEGTVIDNPCSMTYAGAKPFSEPETFGMASYISSIAHNIVTYISFHSYGQYLMVPYGYTTRHLDNYDVTMGVANKATWALFNRNGTFYSYGNIAEILYDKVPGNSVDWVKGVHHIPYVYIYQLRDNGQFGFLLPPEQIIPTSEETMDSLVVILQAALSNPNGK